MSRRIVRDDIRSETFYVKNGIEVCPDCEQQVCECVPVIECPRCTSEIVYCVEKENYVCQSYMHWWCGWEYDWEFQIPYSGSELDQARAEDHIREVI